MIRANFDAYNSYVTDSLHQWDINQDLAISGLNLTIAPEIHFANDLMDRAIVRQSALSSGVVTVRIPNSLLQEALTIKAYVGLYKDTTFSIIETIEIPVIAKARPSDYKIEDSDEEIYSFDRLENEIANMITCNDFNATVSRLSSEAENNKKALENQIANIVAINNKTDGNSELVDIRTGADGIVYPSAGDAVRNQVEDFKKISHLAINFEQGKYLDKDGNAYNYAQFETSDFISLIDEVGNIRRDLYISCITNKASCVCFYDSNKKLILADTVQTETFSEYRGTTVGIEGCYYVRISNRIGANKKIISFINFDEIDNTYMYDMLPTKNGNMLFPYDSGVKKGKYIHTQGNIIDYEGLFVSAPIFVKKGITYKFTQNSSTFGKKAYCAVCDRYGNVKRGRALDIVDDCVVCTADENGFMMINFADDSYKFTEEEIFDKVIITRGEVKPSRLAGLKIAYNGDSIAESRTSGTASNGGGYPKLIAEKTGSTYVNRAVGGGVLAVQEGRHNVVTDIVNMPDDADLICLEGGINDYWRSIPMGTFSKTDYNNVLDNTTVLGALEDILRQSIKKWVGKPICFVIVHKVLDTAWTKNSQGYTFEELREQMIGLLNKYSIPYYDCYEKGGLNAYIDELNNAYLTGGESTSGDGCHPNKEGYERYYVPQLISLFESILPMTD